MSVHENRYILTIKCAVCNEQYQDIRMCALHLYGRHQIKIVSLLCTRVFDKG